MKKMKLDVQRIKCCSGLTNNSNFIIESKTFMRIKNVIKCGVLPRKTNGKLVIIVKLAVTVTQQHFWE